MNNKINELILAALFLFAFCSSTFSQRLPNLQISDEEIRSFVNDLRNANPPLDLPVDFQGHTSNRDAKDEAAQGLFQNVDLSSLLLASDSIRALVKLYDNYNPQMGQPELETAQERAEVRTFLDAIFDSRAMQQLYFLLQQKRHPFASDHTNFRRFFEQLWYGQYSRARGRPDSSGFEHVFIGEFKNDEVAGLHSWIRFLYLEKNAFANRFDYKGFLVKRKNIFGSVKYTWQGRVKPGGSFLIGTLPEFDFALFTLCFLARRGGHTSCNFEIDGCPMVVTSFDLEQQGRTFIGSMYPSAGRMTAECGRTGAKFQIGFIHQTPLIKQSSRRR